MLSRITSMLLFCLMMGQISAQEIWCGTDYSDYYESELGKAHNKEIQDILEMAYWEDSRDGLPPILVIPTVVHIIHFYGPEFNLTDDDVQGMIDRMNDDFNNASADTAQISQPFRSRVGNTRIEFRLARIDPQGNCTNGITRHVSPLTNLGNAQMKNLVLWPRSRYYKIWVCRQPAGGANVLGYFSPGENNDRDGIVVRHTEVNYASRTMTHETGHWLNLSHTWGPTNNPGLETNCFLSGGQQDFVADTPPTIGNLTNACPLTQWTCQDQQPANDPVQRDNIENHMDYTGCARMFTQGQSDRMRAAAFATTRLRHLLHTQANLVQTGVDGNYGPVCLTDFTIDRTFGCSGLTVTVTCRSYHDITEREWITPGGTIISNTANNKSVTIQYDNPGDFDITLNVTNQNGDTGTTTKEDIVHVMAPTVNDFFFEGFEGVPSIPNENWIVESIDNGASGTWQINTNAGFNSNTSAFIPNFTKPEGRTDNLILRIPVNAAVDSGFTYQLSFNYAFAATTTGNSVDRLRVLTSANCGENWSVRANILNNALRTAPITTGQFVPSSADDWGQRIINLPANFTSNELIVRFEWTSGPGNNIYIDNINLVNLQTVNVDELSLEPFSVKVYPNPANINSVVEVNLQTPAPIDLEIYDLAGRKIATLAQSNQLGSGTHIFELGDKLKQSGVYLVRLSSNGTQKTTKVVFQR
ncbi:MAG: M43 family zinc metalloprotease [Luteibaculaceae bacterium]